jgi:hypothetical protein
MKPKKDAGRVLVTLGSAPWFLELFQELVDSYSQRPMSPHQRDLMSGSLWTNLIKLYTKCPDCVSEFKDKKGRELRDAYEKAFDKSRLLKPNGGIEPKKVYVIPKGRQIQMTMSGKSARVTVVKYKGTIYAAQKESPDAYQKRTGKCPKGMHINVKTGKCQDIHELAYKGHINVFDNPDVAKVSERRSRSPLHFLAETVRSKDKAEAILRHPQASKVKDLMVGNTPLHNLASRGYDASSHPDWDKVKNEYGYTPKDKFEHNKGLGGSRVFDRKTSK